MLTSLVAAISVLAVTTSAQNSDTQCYRRTNNDTQPTRANWFACNNTSVLSGGPELCCINGYECGEGSICRAMDGNETRWMIGGCTDPSYKDPVCSLHCDGDKMRFITYENGKWHCCGNDGCDSGTPTDESFNALSPAQWTPVSDDKGPITSSPTNSPSPNSGGGGISTGAEVGIAVAGLVGFALIAGGLFWWRTKNKKSRTNYRGVQGKYEELGRVGRSDVRGTSPVPFGARDASPQRYGARDTSPEPYGRSLSPVPPVRAMEPQRARSRSPQPEDRLSPPGEEEEPGESERLGSFYKDPE